VVCNSYCNFRITAAYANEIALIEGIPTSGSVGKEKAVIYRYDFD